MAQGLDEGDGYTAVELAAEVGDVSLDDVGVMLPVVVVEVLEQFFAGDDDAGSMHEVFEDAVFGGGEIDGTAIANNDLLERVEFDAGVAKDRMGCAFSTADEGFDASHEFAEVEGLAEVVVGSGVEQLDDGAGAFAGGEDKDRGCVVARSKAAKQGLSALAGKQEIQKVLGPDGEKTIRENTTKYYPRYARQGERLIRNFVQFLKVY